MFLLDTNVISEYRKMAEANAGVISFFANNDANEMYLCVQVVGEIQAGIQNLSDMGASSKANIYLAWLENDLLQNYPGRILPFDLDVARMWGTLNSGIREDPHVVDRQIAAVALSYDNMTVVTRDIDSPGFKAGVANGLALLNPFI